jgi:hypothetical protein
VSSSPASAENQKTTGARTDLPPEPQSLFPRAVTSSISPLTNYETSAVNFARLIQRHVKQIGRSDPLTALQYIYLIGLSADAPPPVGKEQVELCHDAIRELVMDSGSYAELLGDIKVDGSKIVRPAVGQRHRRRRAY